jgi:hypothetical protein
MTSRGRGGFGFARLRRRGAAFAVVAVEAMLDVGATVPAPGCVRRAEPGATI